jgi:integrase/recombinase XerD
VPLELWPAGDHAAWQAALKPSDVFEPGGVASRWSAATQRKTALGYGRYLFWLQQQGNLDVTLAPARRVERDLVRAYLQELKLTNRGHALHNRIQELGNAMRHSPPKMIGGGRCGRPTGCASVRFRPRICARASGRSPILSPRACA